VADSITFTGVNGSLAASVTFEMDFGGSVLTVTLTNTSSADVLVPTDVLTAVFFNLTGPQLTPDTALLPPGSTVFHAPVGGEGPDVAGEWAYASGLVGAPGSATHGISSSGLGLFGAANFVGAGNLQGPDAVDGLQYGLTSAGDDPSTGNAPVTGDNALIHNSVAFALTFDQAEAQCNTLDQCFVIDNVTFQYGTALNEGPGEPIPEPGTMLLLGAGLTALAARRRR